jgi:3-isopropylmalate/(R)-2-methylmalate dehydratase small subunit
VAEQPFEAFTSRVIPLPAENVDTDQIVPARFLKVTDKAGLGEALFRDWRYNEDGSLREPRFVLDKPEMAGRKILLAGDNFGCGSSREHAPWALEGAGFKAVVAPSFADIFRTNCTKIGLLPVTLPELDVGEIIDAAVAEPGTRVVVDLERLVATLPGGREVDFEIEPDVRERLLNGWDDISLTLAREEAIARYERERERDGPVTTALG